MSYKVGVKTQGDSTWVWNQMRFETKEEAETYAKKLMSRWMAVQGWIIQESTDPVNAQCPDGER